ncbi:MAG TPA: TlpA disulfide reductase family protein [Usitatibacter sp.]|jgi:thiol-disulfide isomerase/thioredoxin|nr:TlpA disulfide reductase family protein [Usitatibacter sp.]
MKAALTFTLVGLATVLGGTGLYLASRPAAPIAAPEISPSAVYAASFHDLQGRPVSLGRFSGHPLVLNFWATWCGPCREEMPALSRVSVRAAPRVQFVGLAQDDPGKVRAFARELAVAYPLWNGGDEVMELSRRLGNRMGVLPFTVILDASGQVVAQKVGAYTERELAGELAPFLR